MRFKIVRQLVCICTSLDLIGCQEHGCSHGTSKNSRLPEIEESETVFEERERQLMMNSCTNIEANMYVPSGSLERCFLKLLQALVISLGLICLIAEVLHQSGESDDEMGCNEVEFTSNMKIGSRIP